MHQWNIKPLTSIKEKNFLNFRQIPAYFANFA